MPKWTTADIPDLSGRRALVTGATSGIGRVAARELARAGARVVYAVRDTDRGAAVAREDGAGTEVRRLDLADLSSVRAFVAELGEEEPLDLLVNNAGVMALPRRETEDGFEMQIGTNHLGHFALTGLLLPALLAAPAPRVVTIASGAHRIGRMNFDDLHGRTRYRRWAAYGQSKLANLLFAFELGRRAASAQTELVSVAAHPGYAATELQTRAARMDGSRVKELANVLANRVLAQDAGSGALPTLYAATDPDLTSGAYAGPDGPGEARGHPTLVGASGRARDEESARRLWELSERETGVEYPWPS